MTALEFLDEYIEEHHSGFLPKREEDITNLMIEFAKYHVEEALEAVNEENPVCSAGESCWLDTDLVKNAYPLKNIK